MYVSYASLATVFVQGEPFELFSLVFVADRICEIFIDLRTSKVILITF